MSCLASVIRCRATTPTVIVDVPAVERLTIDALSVLVRKAMRLRSAAGELLLAGPGPALRKVKERTGTGPLLSAFPDSAAALRALAGDGRTWQRVGLAPGAVPCSPSPRHRDATDRNHLVKELQRYVTDWGGRFVTPSRRPSGPRRDSR
ncbi:hypothetical protein [Streptomyces sp. NPDC045470]|uniref:hypothetical protein n=1 Tax=Streptomyces sp. NPDC045470 TaxID=3155469 RepID=UPI00340C8292